MKDDFLHLFLRRNNITDLKKKIAKHNENSAVSFSEYKNQKLSEIAETLSHKTRIYLDTKFWIEFRTAIYNKKKI